MAERSNTNSLTVDVLIGHNQSTGKLTQLNFERVRNLTQLIISKQNLRFLARGVFDRLRDMQSCDLSNNLISDLPGDLFDRNPKLETIDFKKNLIEKIDCDLFSKVLNLKRLNLSYNRIRTLAANCFYSMFLEELDLSFNNLIEIDENAFRFLVALQVLKLSNNLLIRLKLRATSSLMILYLNNNLITDFELNWRLLKVLNLAENCLMAVRITSLAEHLTVLDLASNDLESVRDHRQFTNAPNLRLLSLKVVREFEFLSIENLVYLQVFKLVYGGPVFAWYLQGITLDYFFRKMINFQNLSLIFDQFTINYFDGFNRFRNLTTFYCECTKPDYEKYTLIDLSGIFSGLQHLDSIELINLNGAKLRKTYETDKTIDRTIQLKHLTVIGLVNVSLTNQFANFRFLESLTVSYNRVEKFGTFTWRNLRNLRALNLEHSRLRKIKRCYFRYNMYLESLNLSNCLIDSIEKHAFMHLIRLRVLNLLANPLSQCAADAFTGLAGHNCQILYDNQNQVLRNILSASQ